jgi:hypothetical protein
VTFVDKQDYSAVTEGDLLELDVKELRKNLRAQNVTKGAEIRLELGIGDRDKDVIKAGGKLSAIKSKQRKS